jgi:hypothetical protein
MRLSPLHSDGRLIDPVFEDSELLYRRILATYVISEDELNPAAISFSKGAPSLIRSKYGTPQDAIHPDCADDQDVTKFDVYGVPASAINLTLVCSQTRRCFDFSGSHAPLTKCYSHSLIDCREKTKENIGYSVPTRPVKNDFRVKFAIAMRNYLRATPVSNASTV